MRKVLLAATLLGLAGNQVQADELAALDKGLFATFEASRTSVDFTVCGSTGQSEGCYGFAELSPPFDYACGVLEGKPKTRSDTVTRAIYVLDKRTSATDPMMLYVYERKDVIANSYDAVSATLKATVNLGITGGASAHCMLAGNLEYVYAGSDVGGAASVNKRSMALAHLAGKTGSSTLLSITADDRGWVAVSYTDQFYVVDPHGNEFEDGGGTAAMINQRAGWIQN